MLLFKFDKIVILMGLGKVFGDVGMGNKVGEIKCFIEVVQYLIMISGQKLQVCKVKKSVLNFKVCEGWDIGFKVILWGYWMYEFIDWLIVVVILCVCDFCGLNLNSFDGCGNYGMGLLEVGVFLEINLDCVLFQQGLNIMVCIMVSNDVEVCKLLILIGMLFKSQELSEQNFQEMCVV